MTWPKIKKVAHKNGTEAYMVDARLQGKGERLFFKTRPEATTAAEQLRIKRKNEGQGAFTMPAAERADAEAALSLLRPHGHTLREAAAFFIKHLAVIRREITVEDLIAELLETRRKDGVSARYVNILRSQLGIFAAAFPGARITDFSTPTLDDWLRALPHSATTRNNYRILLGVLFNYGVGRGYCLANPVKATQRAKPVEKPPGVLTVAQSARLLEAAEPELVPGVALALFAGLRPESEIWRLDWRHIDFETRLINIEPDRTKTAQRRFVRMNDNLVEWLLPHRRAEGPVSAKGSVYFRQLWKARAAAEIKVWPADCCRHSFASYHFAHFKNAGETAQELGHADLKMLFKHYRERVKPAEAARFWEIRPAAEQERKVVQMVA